MALELGAGHALRLLAWLAVVGVGVALLARRPDAAGRAFAFWAAVWGGGIQVVLTLQAAATDPPTQQLLYRVAYYAVLASSSAVLAMLLYAPRRLPRANLLLAGLLAVPVLAGLAFAAGHGLFIVERLDGGYAVQNTPLMQLGFPVAVWTGFLLAMLHLAHHAPRLLPQEQRSATWMMAGLALFAGDRFARTAAQWVRDPASLGAPPEGLVYGLFMLAFGACVLLLALRSRGLPGANVTLAALLGLAVGSTTIATYGMPALGGGLSAGVVLSALLAPVYAGMLAQGVREAPTGALVVAKDGRAAALAET